MACDLAWLVTSCSPILDTDMMMDLFYLLDQQLVKIVKPSKAFYHFTSLYYRPTKLVSKSCWLHPNYSLLYQMCITHLKCHLSINKVAVLCQCQLLCGGKSAQPRLRHAHIKITWFSTVKITSQREREKQIVTVECHSGKQNEQRYIKQTDMTKSSSSFRKHGI